MSSVSNHSGAGDGAPAELFVLSDEQILEIEPENAAASDEWRVASEGSSSPRGQNPSSHAQVLDGDQNGHESVVANQEASGAGHAAQENGAQQQSSQRHRAQEHGAEPGVPALPHEPPPWLADLMADPQASGEARDLWDGIQHARQQAAEADAYRAAFASPEDARALKELYPGGVTEARGAAQRARMLDEIDRAYFGAQGGSPEHTSAARTQLAAAMLRADPAAFREMVFAGLRALEQASQQAPASAHANASPRVPSQPTAPQHNGSPAPGSHPSAAQAANSSPHAGGAQSAPAAHANPPASDARLAAYAAFEKAANADLERSVGGAIDRALQNALPGVKRVESADASGRNAVPLNERLGGAIREEVERALQGDRQLGQQVAQVLASRRLDDQARAQVVRLIDERARQLVPGAARRVIGEWTQTTLAAHRARTGRSDDPDSGREAAANSRNDRAQPGVAVLRDASGSGDARQGSTLRTDGARRAEYALEPRRPDSSSEPRRGSAPSRSRRVDYRRLSDEQILDM